MTIGTFLQQDPEKRVAMIVPEANVYEFRSGGVIEMVEKLLDEFIIKRTTLEKEEMHPKHVCDMFIQDLKAQLEKAAFKAGILQ